MQSFTAIPPWPQSLVLPIVLALGSTSLTWLLYQRRQEIEKARERESGLLLGDLKWLPRLSLSVAITSIVIAILIGADSGNGRKVGLIIGACYLQVGSSACLLYEGSTVMINKTNFLFSWPWARRLLRPSYGTLPTSILLCILVITQAAKIRKTAVPFLFLTSAFDACDATRVLLAMKDIVMKPYEKRPEDLTPLKKFGTAFSWFVKGFSEEHRKLFIFIIVRNWVVLIVDILGSMVFCFGSKAFQPWILQSAPIPGLLSSLVWVTRWSGRQVSGVGRKPLSSKTELVTGEP